MGATLGDDTIKAAHQQVSASLSKPGGTSPGTDLTSQALAEMSEERFAEVVNELQARGDKTKLMQLVWSLIMSHVLCYTFIK